MLGSPGQLLSIPHRGSSRPRGFRCCKRVNTSLEVALLREMDLSIPAPSTGTHRDSLSNWFDCYWRGKGASRAVIAACIDGTRSNRVLGMATKRSRTPMSDEHKAALAEGRNQGRSVRRYLEALEAHKPKRGRKRTPESIQKRLASIESSIGNVDALKRLQLIQERLDLQGELEATEAKVDLSELEQEFVQAAAPYSERKGISYAAWRELGVDAAVLKRAGISRAS